MNTSDNTFQKRATVWIQDCFGDAIADSIQERNLRFLEEALELVQAGNMSKEDAHKLVDYVFSRPLGETNQEIGGVMITLAALSRVHGTNMLDCGEEDLAMARINTDKIRNKWETKPKYIRGNALVVERQTHTP